MNTYIQVQLIASVLAIVVASSTNSSFTMDYICASAGVLGGTIIQLLTYIERKPHITVILGNILASASLGWGVYASNGSLLNSVVESPLKCRELVVLAILVGATGAARTRIGALTITEGDTTT